MGESGTTGRETDLVAKAGRAYPYTSDLIFKPPLPFAGSTLSSCKGRKRGEEKRREVGHMKESGGGERQGGWKVVIIPQP